MNKLIPVIAVLFATSAFANDHGAPAQTTEGGAPAAAEAKQAAAPKKVKKAMKKKKDAGHTTEAPATHQ